MFRSIPLPSPVVGDYGTKFKVPRFAIYQAICEVLADCGRLIEATECFHTLTNDVEWKTTADDEHRHWVLGELCW